MEADSIFHKYPKIRVLGHKENANIFTDPEDEIVIEEKIDGASFRFYVNDGKLVFGSRQITLGNEDDKIGGNWLRCIEYLKQKIDATEIDMPLIFYGECCVRHSVPYDFTTMPPFLGFDILCDGQFMDYEMKRDTFADIGLPMVPLIAIKKAGEITEINDDNIPQSQYYPGPAEGIVFKNYKRQIFAKFVSNKFKEVNHVTFGGSKKFAANDDERFISKYCTNARIDKIIFKLLDEGHELAMELMRELPKQVYADIIEEEWQEIAYSSWCIHFKLVQKAVASRCAAVLKQVIVNNALNSKPS
jgi:hypothetical protein